MKDSDDFGTFPGNEVVDGMSVTKGREEHEYSLYTVELAFGHLRFDGQPLPSEVITQVEQKALQIFAALFFGSQIFRCTGSYVTSSGKLLLEPCTLVRAYAQTGEGTYIRSVWDLAEEIAVNLEQESVLFTILRQSGTLHYVVAGSRYHRPR